jgi:hypothetical protein
MRPALDRLLAASIDYAGLFPPARLELPETLASYRRYRAGAEAWIVNRLVIPSARLGELASLIQAGDSVPLAVTGRPSTDRATWEMARSEDATQMSAFQAEFGERAPIEVYEVRVPDNTDFASWLADLHGFRDAEVFAELPWGDAMLTSVSVAAEAEWINLKVRTGGETAEAFPSAEALGEFLQAVTQLEVPFKLTAGLHHPLPTVDGATGAKMHGFLNVAAGVAIAMANDLSLREWEELLACDTSSLFQFSDTALAVGSWSADLAAIEHARELYVGFGSCSVSEPLEGLVDVGLVAQSC